MRGPEGPWSALSGVAWPSHIEAGARRKHPDRREGDFFRRHRRLCAGSKGGEREVAFHDSMSPLSLLSPMSPLSLLSLWGAPIRGHPGTYGDKGMSPLKPAEIRHFLAISGGRGHRGHGMCEKAESQQNGRKRGHSVGDSPPIFVPVCPRSIS